MRDHRGNDAVAQKFEAFVADCSSVLDRVRLVRERFLEQLGVLELNADLFFEMR
jgi:hypothetical protein